MQTKTIASFLFVLLLFMLENGKAQSTGLILRPAAPLEVEGWQDNAGKLLRFPTPLPLFSFRTNGVQRKSSDADILPSAGDTLRFSDGALLLEVIPVQGARFKIHLYNRSASDTIRIDNLVPLGTNHNHTYITGLGDHPLSRAHLFRPDFSPVNIILPDNAWELGYAGVEVNEGQGICSISRRISWNEKARRRRFETILYPGGSVTYQLWAETYAGTWQEGLRRIFQEKYLYDLEGRAFDESLYLRPDLQWIRKAFAMHLIMAWDRDFFDPATQSYQLEYFLKKIRPLLGLTDVVGIWPNWPMLGLDQRNQWDLFRDLPGGLPQVKKQVQMARGYGTKFFISYNPWDESTRWEDHHAGMADMIKALDADGVVLDTEGKSSPERQSAADAVRPGVIMYSEGMAVPRDMPSIVAGRVHNALYYPPLLNLNKFIRPDFAIFRVAELFKEPIRREFALSLFNGYGTEINQFQPGRPEWLEEQYRFWGRILLTQRQNASAFTVKAYRPLIPTLRDSIYANEWPAADKTLYTLFSLIPQGFRGPLFQIPVRPDFHLVDLWNHELITPDTLHGQWQVRCDLEAFSEKWLGTNNEGAVGAIGVLPILLDIKRLGNFLICNSPPGGTISFWQGDPTYEKKPHSIPSGGSDTLNLYKIFGPYEGKIVVQLLIDDALRDEQIFFIPPSLPRLISISQPTARVSTPPPGMVEIPSGRFTMQVTYGDNFIPHPTDYPEGAFNMKGFYMDKFPVTNAGFREFLQKSRYTPSDTTNFLKHWHKGRIPKGQENFPVTYVSYEDAQAFAAWAGKRLPTETEWQYAAQTADLREWPWSREAKVERKEEVITNTLTVSRIVADSSLCNPGNGKLYPVGSYPKGANPLGLEDLTGCVWQLTNDLYINGANTFLILKGGSYYLPASSWWYVEGGPRTLNYSQKLLRVSPGFERNATTGFRCVKDN